MTITNFQHTFLQLTTACPPRLLRMFYLSCARDGTHPNSLTILGIKLVILKNNLTLLYYFIKLDLLTSKLPLDKLNAILIIYKKY